MGPLIPGISDDPVFWFSVRPILSGALVHHWPDKLVTIAGPLVSSSSVGTLSSRPSCGILKNFGYKTGSEITKDMPGGILKDITKRASILGMFILAVLVERWYLSSSL